MFDPAKVKKDFPILSRQVHGRPLVYLDNAASSQKPQAVIDAIADYYQNHNANVHRGVHTLSDESTTLFDQSRQTIAQFLGAQAEELILVRNTTEAVNGVAYGWADHNLKKGDVILTSLMEHHSNLVVWQEATKRTGVQLEYVELTEDGRLDLNDLEAKLKQFADKVKLLALVHVSNTLGTVNPIPEIVKLVEKAGLKDSVRILLDGAQAVPHMKVNFADLGIDFFAFSGHKMLGPMGAGGLLVRRELLATGEMKPWLFGGGMISEVYTDKTKFNEDLSELFVAGTPDVASAVGLAAACDYLSGLSMDQVEKHDRDLVAYALEKLGQVPEVKLVGPQAEDRLGSVAFVYQDVHAHDVAQVLDSEGIAVRSGHHCTMPLHQHFKWQATIRASFQVYNSREDVDTLIQGLEKVKQIFKK